MEMERMGQPYDTVTNSLLAESDSLIINDGKDPQMLSDFQKSKYWQQTAFKYIFKYPLPFAKSYARGIFHCFFNLGTSVFSHLLNLKQNDNQVFDIKAHPNVSELIKVWVKQKSLSEILLGLTIAVFLLISYTLTIIGFIVSWKNYDSTFLIFCIMMILYFVILSGPQGLERYKLPSIPFYLAFAGIGFDYIMNKRKRVTNSTR